MKRDSWVIIKARLHSIQQMTFIEYYQCVYIGFKNLSSK